MGLSGTGLRGTAPPLPGSRTSRNTRQNLRHGRFLPCPDTCRCTRESHRRLTPRDSSWCRPSAARWRDRRLPPGTQGDRARARSRLQLLSGRRQRRRCSPRRPISFNIGRICCEPESYSVIFAYSENSHLMHLPLPIFAFQVVLLAESNEVVGYNME